MTTLIELTGYPKDVLVTCAEMKPGDDTTFCTEPAGHGGRHCHEYSGRTWRPAQPPSGAPASVKGGRE